MTSQAIDLPGNALLALTRDSLLTIRDAMFRDIGPNAAAVLQEAGYAGGPALFDAFSQWLASRGAPAPESSPPRNLDRGPRSSFARPAGDPSSWAPLDSVATLDSADWAESDPAHPLEFPGLLLHVRRAGRLLHALGRRAAVGDGSRMPVDGRRAVSLSRRQRRDDAACLRGDGRGCEYERRWRAADVR